ncbi:hypothetical protein Tco_1404162 [Tanacetum coccineum]
MAANSTTEAEYVAASSCCGQVLWIQNQLLDYGYNFMHTKIYIDNESTICIVKNPVFHSKTKHIEIRHNFIRDSNEKKLIQMIKIHTDKNVTDLLRKAFDIRRCEKDSLEQLQPSYSLNHDRFKLKKEIDSTERDNLHNVLSTAIEKRQAKKLERKRKSKTLGMKRLFKVSRAVQVVSSKDEDRGQKRERTEFSWWAGEVSYAGELRGLGVVLGGGGGGVCGGRLGRCVNEAWDERVSWSDGVDRAAAYCGRAGMCEGVLVCRYAIRPSRRIKTHHKTLAMNDNCAFKLQAVEEEQARLVREKAKKVKEANISWDNVKAMIEANRLLAERLQVREQEELTDEEKARLSLIEHLWRRKEIA